jgi:sugar O-acyltransferase (sialic acid O-acetyltransferase NeuD family)
MADSTPPGPVASQPLDAPVPKIGEKLVIVGDGEFAEIAYEYFTHDSPFEVVAFSVEASYLQRDSLFGLPVVPFEQVESLYAPVEHRIFIAVTHTQLNRVRRRLYRAAKQKGYAPVSYVSTRAFVWHNVAIGENCFVFEHNVLQYHARLGDNVILWSGNHIGHRSVIGDHCFLSSHVVISGYCEIGESCFFGVNSAVGNNVKVGQDCVIGAGTVLTRDTVPGKVYKAEREPSPRASSLALFKVKAADR